MHFACYSVVFFKVLYLTCTYYKKTTNNFYLFGFYINLFKLHVFITLATVMVGFSGSLETSKPKLASSLFHFLHFRCFCNPLRCMVQIVWWLPYLWSLSQWILKQVLSFTTGGVDTAKGLGPQPQLNQLSKILSKIIKL